MEAKLVLATNNKDKARELQSLTGGLGIAILLLDAFPSMGEIVEDGATLEENALKKAREAFRHTGLPSLADDSGLEVHYLRGEPGVYSSRYSGPGATYESNCRKLLEEMKGVAPRRRGARFRSVLAFVAPEMETTVEGVCRGVITESPRGANGFGYDPVFAPVNSAGTFAEMTPIEKNSLSHRAKALRLMLPVLGTFFPHHQG